MRVSLFVTCLIDLYYPDTGESVVSLLERQGIEVEFLSSQTCCGRFALEAGDQDAASGLAREFVDLFQNTDLILVPSAACAAMIKTEYPWLLPADSRVASIAARTWELSQFLVDVLQISDLGAHYAGKIVYQPACHLLHDLHAARQAPALLQAVSGATQVSMAEAEECCGFGGPFSERLPEISAAILESRVQAVVDSGADVVVTCDAGCLTHLNGGLSRRGCKARAVHLADLLAGNVAEPPPPAAKPEAARPKPRRRRAW